MKNVYYSLIYSHIIYAIEAWGSACKTELDKIFILQKRAMRLMTYDIEDKKYFNVCFKKLMVDAYEH